MLLDSLNYILCRLGVGFPPLQSAWRHIQVFLVYRDIKRQDREKRLLSTTFPLPSLLLRREVYRAERILDMFKMRNVKATKRAESKIQGRHSLRHVCFARRLSPRCQTEFESRLFRQEYMLSLRVNTRCTREHRESEEE